MRILLSAFAAFTVVTATAAPAFSAPCRDGRGRFVKCDTQKPVSPKRCRDNRGKFIKCNLAKGGEAQGDQGHENRGN